MKYRNICSIMVIVLLLNLMSACSQVVSPPTATPTPAPPEATATKTAKPTYTPKPSPTPNVAATQKVKDFNALLAGFKEKDYITTTVGEFSELEPFKEEWAQLGWYNNYPPFIESKDFVFNGHFKWSTANEQSDLSGCGVIFGAKENGDHYAVFLDKVRILFLMKRGSHSYNVGKTSGPGKVNFDIPAEADFTLAVKGQSAYVSVNGEVTEYTLSADQASSGVFFFSILSGTNKDYGTRCEMTNLIFWQPK